MKRILLPTDFSDNALQAMNYALQIFEAQECTFFLMHTYTPPVYHTEYLIGSPGQIGLGDVMHETSLTQLEQLQVQLAAKYQNPKHGFVVHTAFNTLVNEVIQTIDNEEIDLVVMGTKGATGAKEILLGTNTVHVIKKATCPVIAVPPNFGYEAPKEILFPTDYEIRYCKEKFGALLTIARQHRSRINVLHVRTGYDLNEFQEKNKSQLESLLGSQGLFHEMPDSGVIDAINSFQIREKINFLVMVQNKHTFLERLFIEPVIKKVGFHITVPFMVIPQL